MARKVLVKVAVVRTHMHKWAEAVRWVAEAAEGTEAVEVVEDVEDVEDMEDAEDAEHAEAAEDAVKEDNLPVLSRFGLMRKDSASSHPLMAAMIVMSTELLLPTVELWCKGLQ